MRCEVYVSGSTGFLGQNLEDYLKRNSPDVAILKLNLRVDSEPELTRGSTVIHLAGIAHDLKNVSKSKEYYHVNYELTKKLYDTFLRSEANRFIFISSVKAVADHEVDNLVEDDKPDPETHYGKSKLMAEEYILSTELPPGKTCYILRPCMIHGPGNKGNLNLLYQFVSKQLPYPLAVFNNKRSFLSVENFCFVIKEILDRDDIPSGVYNLADDEALSTSEVVSLLAKAQGTRPKFWRLPAGLILLIAKIGDKLNLPLTTVRLKKLTENYVVSNKKIKDALRRELPVSAREGILITARSFKKK